MTKADKQLFISKITPWVMLIAGAIAMLASILLAVEVFNRLHDPSYTPACNLNPIFSCTSVADSQQAHVFGFPNYFIGIAGFAAVASLGAALLAGAVFKRWLWRAVQAGITLAMLFTAWLQFESLYRIGALCLYCMVVWASVIPVFWYVTLYNLAHGHIQVPARLKGTVEFAQKHHLDILIAWFLVILVLILKRFWYYWSTLL